MKTLDEVIKALEICTSDIGGCENCPYAPDCKPDNKWDDALYYLKEYRETVTKCIELRTGIWIPVDSETVNGRCSVCGYESHLYENDVYGEHYCPNCGAWLRLT